MISVSINVTPLIPGGTDGVSEALNTVEVVSSDPTLSERVVPNFTYPVLHPVAVWVQGGVLVCGGMAKIITNNIQVQLSNTFDEDTKTALEIGHLL